MEQTKPVSKIEELAHKIKDLLEQHDCFIDVRIYFEGKALTQEGILENMNPLDFTEYVNQETITMTFEGDFYEVMNDDYLPDLYAKFDGLVRSYGYYHELGHAYSLALFQ